MMNRVAWITLCPDTTATNQALSACKTQEVNITILVSRFVKLKYLDQTIVRKDQSFYHNISLRWYFQELLKLPNLVHSRLELSLLMLYQQRRQLLTIKC